MKKLLLAALTTLSLVVHQEAVQANPLQRCTDLYGDTLRCSQMLSVVQDDQEFEDYWFDCVPVLGSLDYCTQILEFGVAREPLQYSWVQVMGGSNVRTEPSTNSEVMVTTRRAPWMITATAVMLVPDDDYRWVEIEFTVGLDAYYGYVREDRVITSLLQ